MYAVTVCIMLHFVRMSKFRVVDEVKQKVLTFLLQNAEDLLVTSGCPIKKVSTREISAREKCKPSDTHSSLLFSLSVQCYT